MYLKRIHLIVIAGFLIFIVFSFSGCMTGQTADQAGLVVPEGVSTQPSLSPQFSVKQSAEGSLWVGENASASMFEDSKAVRVGDTVIVDIVENSSSSMDVNTEAGRTTKMDIGIPSINLLGDKSVFGGLGGKTKLLGTDYSNSFEGEAKSDRSGQVTASIAARVTEILPNGNLSVFGRRAMKVNNEVQYITVSGVIRPQDISASNRVKSTYLADSRIEYYGKGALADKQKPGWGVRLMDNLWPW